MDPGHGLSDALLASLREFTGLQALRYARPPVAMKGGRSSDLYAFSIADPPPQLHGDLVARFPNDVSGATREAAIQSAVAAAGYPAPLIRWVGTCDSRPFVVMDRIDGKTPLAAAGITGVPRLFRELPALLAGLMADLHAVEIPPGLDPGINADALMADVTDEHARSWLTANRPSAERTVICHGDLHGENILVADGDVVAVLDWELAGVAALELDVARTALILELLPGLSRIGQRVLRSAGPRSARAFRDAYAARRPFDAEALRWYDALHCARLLAVAERDGTVAELWRPLTVALRGRLVRALAGE